MAGFLAWIVAARRTYLFLGPCLFRLQVVQLVLDVLLLDLDQLELVLKLFHLEVEVFLFLFGGLLGGLAGYTVNFHSRFSCVRLVWLRVSFEFN